MGKYTLKTKLLILLAIIIVSPILYITYSSIQIESQDKLNNAQQSQLTELKLLNEKINSLINNASNTLRNIASISHQTKTFAEYHEEISLILKNQVEIKNLYIFEVPLIKGETISLKFADKNNDDLYKMINNSIVKNFSKISNKKNLFIDKLKIHDQDFLLYTLVDQEYDTYKTKVLTYSALIDLKNYDNFFNFPVLVLNDNNEVIYSSEKSFYQKDMNFLNNILSTVRHSAISLEIKDQNEVFVYSIDKINHGMYTIVLQPKIKILNYLYQFVQRTILIGLISLFLALFIMTKVIQKIIGEPIAKLKEATSTISKGNFDVSIDLDSKDEMGELAHSFNAMSSEINTLLEDKITKTKMENELNISATVQNNILPPTFIKDEKYDIYSYYQAASYCGGDLWNYFKVRNHLYVFIADATGHELSSAFITFSAKTVFSIVETMLNDSLNEMLPNDILFLANKAIYDSSKGNINMTMFCARIDLSSGECVYANAGHNPPWLINKEKLVSLCSTGPRLGANNKVGKHDFENKTVWINSNSKLLLYTDGIIEGMVLNEQYGKKRLLNSIKKPLSEKNPLFNVLNDFLIFMNYPTNLEDDLTLVYIDFSKGHYKNVA